MSQPLIDHVVEVGTEPVAVNADLRLRQNGYLFARDERSPTRAKGTKLRNRFAVAGNDERLPCRHGFHHLGVVVAQLALRDGPRHDTTVATLLRCATTSERDKAASAEVRHDLIREQSQLLLDSATPSRVCPVNAFTNEASVMAAMTWLTPVPSSRT